MELRTLQYFLAVVREENISRAADYLHLTQPTFSRQIAQLEEELGTQLFVRGRHLALTDAGIMLRHRAEEVVSLMDKIESEFEEQSGMGGIISIGYGGLGAMWALPAVMNSFCQKYSKVQYQFYTNSTDFIKERLDQGLLDFGLLLEPIVSLFGGGLIFRSLYLELSMTSVLAWKKFQPNSGAAGKFLEHFKSMQ